MFHSLGCTDCAHCSFDIHYVGGNYVEGNYVGGNYCMCMRPGVALGLSETSVKCTNAVPCMPFSVVAGGLSDIANSVLPLSSGPPWLLLRRRCRRMK